MLSSGMVRGQLKPGKKAFGSKWVYKIKYRSDGSVERYKDRSVVCGNKQVPGEYYTETFAPGSLPLFLYVAAYGPFIRWINAFLHGDLY